MDGCHGRHVKIEKYHILAVSSERKEIF